MSRPFGSERQSSVSPAPFGEPAAEETPSRPSEPPSEHESLRDVVQEEDFLFHLYRGSELLQGNRVVEAKHELEYALTMQPSDPKGRDLLAAVCFRLGLYPRAIQIYEALAVQFDRDVSIKINVALAYLKTGRAEAARAVLTEAIHLDPEHKRAWGYLGLAHQKLGEFEAAAQAFEYGGHTMMAKRAGERRRSVPASSSMPPDNAARDGNAHGSAVDDASFVELDRGELRVSLATPDPMPDAGGPRRPENLRQATMPFFARDDVRETRVEAHVAMPAAPGLEASGAPGAYAATRLPPPPMHVPAPRERDGSFRAEASLSSRGAVSTPSAVRTRRHAPPSLFNLDAGQNIGLEPGGLVLVRTGDEASRGFAGRLDSLRSVGGTASTRVLYRRTRDGDTTEVFGGVGSPLVRIGGDAEIVLGARPLHSVVFVRLDQDLAFLREDVLLGFELSLAYENGRVALDAGASGGEGGEGARTAVEGVPVVQLRGTGTAAVELSGRLTSVDSVAGTPLLVRREWVIGWLGRLVPRACAWADLPITQRGMVSFAGEGVVLVSAG